MLAATQIS